MNKENLLYYCNDCGIKINSWTALYGQGRCKSCSRIGKLSWRFGKHLSNKTKNLISKSNKGKRRSESMCLKISKRMKGKNNHFFGKCHTKEIKLKLSKSHQGKKISKETRLKISKSLKGKNSYLWQGGISFFPYTLKFNKELKQNIRQRDGFNCQICGINEDKNYRDGKQVKLAIHHIDYNKQNCGKDNLISLCLSCHLKTNHNRDYWHAYCRYLLDKT